MKNINIYLLVILIVNFSCDGMLNQKTVIGSGNLLETEREVSGFHGIKVSNGIDVFFSQGDTEELLLIADDNLHEHIETVVTDGVLRIRSDVNIRQAKEKKVMLKVKELNKIRISSSGDVISENQLVTDDLEISVSSSGDLKLDVRAKSIDCSISSSGDAILTGQTDYLEADLSSSGKLDAYGLEVKKADIETSSSGDANVFITDEAEMDASSGGDIRYKGDPRVINSNSSSGGSIKKVD